MAEKQKQVISLLNKLKEKITELSKAFIKPIILGRNKYLNDDNWELGLDYTDFTGSDMQNAFESGFDSCTKDLYENKGYPIDLNGNIVPYDEALKNIELYNNHMKEQLIDKACEWLNNFYSEDRHCYLVAEDIQAFKQAMEEE